MASHATAPAIEQANLPSKLHRVPLVLPPAEIRRNYRLGVINGVLGVLSLISLSVGLAAFAIVKEPPQTQLGPRLRVTEGLRRAPAIMHANANYRWCIISRMLTRVGQIAEPFYIIYATEALRLPAGVAGIYLAVRAITGALSNVVWGRMSDQRGNRRLVLASGVLVALTPALALALPSVSGALGLG